MTSDPSLLTSFSARLRDDGLSATLGWAAEWVYWRTPLRRLGLPQRLGAGQPPSAHLGQPVICHDLKSWCAQAGPPASYVTVEPPQRLTRRPPLTVDPAVPDEFTEYYEVEAPERGLAGVPSARLLTTNGLLQLPDGQLVGQTMALTPAGQARVIASQLASDYFSPRPARRLRGRFFAALVPGSSNYYHWLHDVVLKIQRVSAHLPADTQFIVPAALKPFQRESLALLGIDPARLRYFRGQQPWELETLYVSVPYPKPLIETAAPLVWLREQARAAYGVAPSGSTRRRLFLSRVADGHFRALNEAELLAGLADLHFEIVRPGQLTFAEQVAFFSEAECIVGTGTGLANMIFAPPGAHIVQWQDPTHIVQSLWTLAEALGHTYHTFNAEPVPSEVPGLNNLRVPLDKLRASLAALN